MLELENEILKVLECLNLLNSFRFIMIKSEELLVVIVD